MRTNPDDSSFMHHDDSVKMSDGRKAVRDDDAGATMKSGAHGILYDSFARVVQACRRLIEDEHGRVLCERAHDADELYLASRKMPTQFTDRDIELFTTEPCVESVESRKT